MLYERVAIEESMSGQDEPDPLMAIAQRFHRKVLHPLWDAVKDAVRRVAEEIQRSADANVLLRAHGWPPLPFDESAMKAEIAAFKEMEGACVQRQLVDAAMLRHYTPERLRGLLEAWEANEVLKPHIGPLRDIISSHIDGRYWVTTPTAYAQVEGILARAFGFRGRVPSKAVDEAFHAVARTVFTLPGDLVALAFWKETRRQFAFGEIERHGAGRHDVLHGANLSYGSAVISLKAILLVDYLHRTLFDGNLIQDGFVHKPGCTLLAHRTAVDYARNQVFLMLHPRAQGVTRCPECQPAFDSMPVPSTRVQPAK